MKFRTIKKAITDLLDVNSLCRFDVIGYQRQSKSSSENTKLVTVYYNNGDFGKGAAGIYGSQPEHNCTFVIELTVYAKAEMDLTVINDPSADAAKRAIAIAALQNGAKKADDLMDELFDEVYQILLDATDPFYGLAENYMQDRWIDNFQKDAPLPQGEDVVLTGRCPLTCSVVEEIGGEAGIPATDQESILDIDGDQGGNAGVAGLGG